MNRLLCATGLVLMLAGLSGCGGDTVAVDDPQQNYTPELRVFDIIDSYDTDTANANHLPLALTPYRYDGLYEVFWDVNSLEDYTVSLRINNRASIGGSLVVHSQVCGAGRRCDQSGGWVCEYTNDFFMSCEGSARETDIFALINKMPQKVYMFIEICDSNSGYCEFDYYPVTLE
jgi:hypothetical protein